MKRSTCAEDFSNVSVMRRPDAASLALADQGYAAPPSKAARLRHVYQPVGDGVETADIYNEHFT